MNILITGGNGFLGSTLVKALTGTHTVHVLEKDISNLFRLRDELDKIRVYPVNDESFNLLFNDNIDLIIHTATLYGKFQNELDLISNNLSVPVDLLVKAVQNKVRWFINTDTVLNRYVSHYSLTKNHFREWLFFHKNKINIINVKLEHFYGFGAGKENFIQSVIQSILENKEYIDLTPGEQQRDFIHIEDVKNAFLAIINSLPLINDGYTEFEVSTGEPFTIKELVMFIKNKMNSDMNLNFGAIPYRENEYFKSRTDSSALKELGWMPKIDIRTGLTETIEKETRAHKDKKN